MPINRRFSKNPSFESATKFKVRPRHIESNIQRACARWFALQYPLLSKLLFAVPNGGSRNALEAKRLKAEGVVAGVSDLILLVPRHGHYGLCIEMKTTAKGSRQSEVQQEFQRAVESQGYKYIICRSVEEFITQIGEYLN